MLQAVSGVLTGGASSSVWLPSVLGANAGLDVLKLENIENVDLEFSNGDSYKGGWRDGQPEGEGRYIWRDGSTYEGSWSAGVKHGWGKYSWGQSGTSYYLGQWDQGRMHGHGTFHSPDGSRYSGSWANNLKHGIGTKVFANGDRREGLFRLGEANGPGRYVWACGNEYDGEWRAGKMHGQGTFLWSTKHRFDGEWCNGVEDGIGVLTYPDGSCYEGFWKNGVKNGVGVFRPAHRSAERERDSHHYQQQHRGASAFFNELGRIRESETDDESDTDALGSPSVPAEGAGPRPIDAAIVELAGVSASVFVCEYDQGALVLEQALQARDLDVAYLAGKAAAKLLGGVGQRLNPLRAQRRRRRRREDPMGETIYKGSRSYDLMLNLQLGIRYTLTTLSKQQSPTQLRPRHFEDKIWLRFPREGSEVTPPHPSGDFKWKDYSPAVFRRLREIFGVDTSSYILSTCGDHALRELPSPGKSGSVFFVSQDEQFIIKTMRKEEMTLLLSALPQYYAHVAAHPDTLLTRFYGLHRIKPASGRKVRFVVMNNIFFNPDLPLHEKYDLKGSTYKRSTGPDAKPSAVLKDLDLDATFQLPPAARNELLRQLTADAAFLKSMHVMDYSLLMGVHHCEHGDAYHSAQTPAIPSKMRPEGEAGDSENATIEEGTWSRTSDQERLAAGEYSPLEEQGSNPLVQSGIAQPITLPPPPPPTVAAAAKASSPPPATPPHTARVAGRRGTVSGDREFDAAPEVASPVSVDRDHELAQRMNSMTSTLSAVTVRHSLLPLGLGKFLAWRREMGDKKRQKKEQAAATAAGSGGGGAPGSLSDTACAANGVAAGQEMPHRRRPSTDAVPLPRKPSGRLLGRAGAAVGPNMRTVPSKVTYSERLAEQHAALVAVLDNNNNAAGSDAHTNGGGGSAGGAGDQPLGASPIAAAVPAAPAGVAWRADAAALPEDHFKWEGGSPVRQQVIRTASSSRGGGPAKLPVLEEEREESGAGTGCASPAPPLPVAVALSFGSNGDGVMRSPFGSVAAEGWDASDSTGGAAGEPSHSHSQSYRTEGVAVTTAGGWEGTPAAATIANSGPLDPPQLPPPSKAKEPLDAATEAIAAHIGSRLSIPIEDRLAHDLARLMRHRILGGRAGASRRVPSDVLSARHVRSNSANRASVDLTNSNSVLLEGGAPRPTAPFSGPALRRFVSATAVHKSFSASSAALSVEAAAAAADGLGALPPADTEEVVLFLGVIDWLQPYNMRKRVEHGFKSVLHDAAAISVQEPARYAKRFIDLMSKVFVVSGSEGADPGAPLSPRKL